jgi:hypothetical protein
MDTCAGIAFPCASPVALSRNVMPVCFKIERTVSAQWMSWLRVDLELNVVDLY